jgi:alkaline phosphatase D
MPPIAGSGGENHPRHASQAHLVLISIDGLRWDFPDLYPMASLQRIATTGARAERLIPVWPTLTFPNHYTIATGLLPANHGLVGNTFLDRDNDRWYRLSNREAVQDGSFYGGLPIWVTAEQQGMVAASFFWVGSEADILGVQPSHWRLYNKQTPATERVEQVLSWLGEPPATRPHLVTLYFEAIDDHAHWFGIGSPEFLEAVQSLDQVLQRLLDGIADLPHGDQVYVMVVSDHGQMPYHDTRPFILDEHIRIRGLEFSDGGPYVFAWQDQPDPQAAQAMADRVNAIWEHGAAWTRDNAPAEWQIQGNSRFPDIIFQADAGYAVISSKAMSTKINKGDHGWAPDTPEMHGAFLVTGPDIRGDQRLGAVRNIDLYPMMIDLLGLPPALEVDGEVGRLSEQLFDTGIQEPSP